MSESKKQFTLEFIELYRSLTALWDVKSQEYRNRVLKEEGYEKLLEKFKERFPKADKKEVAKKLNTLRTNFRREWKRMREAEKSGAGAEDCYETSLYYFDALSFLSDVITPCASRSNFERSGEPTNKKEKCSTTDEFLVLATEQLKKPEDACQQIANVWGSKLSGMQQNQRLLSERIINDVLFHGQLGLLNLNSSLSNVNKLRDMNHLRNMSHSPTPVPTTNSANFSTDSSLDSLRSNFTSKGILSHTNPVLVKKPVPVYVQEEQQHELSSGESPICVFKAEPEEISYSECVIDENPPEVQTFFSFLK